MFQYGQRDSIKSSSSDELYERLSFGEAACHPDAISISTVLEETIAADKTGEDPSATPTSNLGARGGTGRGSGGKGKLTTGW